MKNKVVQDQFKTFIIVKINVQRRQYKIKIEMAADDYFTEHWWSFFGELVTECLRLSDLYQFDVDDGNSLAGELQKIAEQGLEDFRKMLRVSKRRCS